MIKQGYMVVIVSFGGDMDDWNTYIKSGLELNQAQWLVHWYDAYYMLTRHENLESTQEVFTRAADKATKKVGGFYPPVEFSYAELEVQGLELDVVYQDVAYEVLGAPCEYTERLRTPVSIKTYNIPRELHDRSDDIFAIE
jgi:hypothetical protein